MNLIVFAMRRFDRDAATCADKGPLVWELTSNKEWWQLLKRCCEKGDTYRKSPSLLAWDLLCCVVASEDASTFAETCKASYLNPDNAELRARAQGLRRRRRGLGRRRRRVDRRRRGRSH